MKIALIGATGNAGSRILAELSRRGHAVTAIARHPEKVPALPGVTALKADAGDVAGLAAALKGHDAIISSVHFTASDPHKLIEAVQASGVGRYLVVGGAGSLEVAPGVRLIDTPEFPAAYKAEAAAGAAFLDLLRKEASSTGPSCRHRRCSRPASAPANSGSAAINCWSTRKAAASRSRTMPLRSPTRSRNPHIRVGASPSAIEAAKKHVVAMPDRDHLIPIASAPGILHEQL